MKAIFLVCLLVLSSCTSDMSENSCDSVNFRVQDIVWEEYSSDKTILARIVKTYSGGGATGNTIYDLVLSEGDSLNGCIILKSNAYYEKFNTGWNGGEIIAAKWVGNKILVRYNKNTIWDFQNYFILESKSSNINSHRIEIILSKTKINQYDHRNKP